MILESILIQDFRRWFGRSSDSSSPRKVTTAGKYQPDLVKAAKTLAGEGVGKYIIFGHTHDALLKDLKKGNKHLNTGTWRKFIEPWSILSQKIDKNLRDREGGVLNKAEYRLDQVG